MNEDKSAKNELDAEEAALRAEAESIDPVRPTDAEIPDVPSEAEQRAPANEKQSAKKTARTDGDKKSDATAADSADSKTTKKTESPEPKTDAKDKPKPDATDDSKLTPFQKERRRLDTTWKQVEADKAELRRQQEQLANERRQLEQQRSAATTKTPDANAVKAEDLEAVAKEFEAEGKLQQAERARAKAKELREQSGAATGEQGGPRERFTKAEVEQIAQEWQANTAKLAKEHPELTDAKSPLYQKTAEILKGTPLLHTAGHGIVLAVAHARVLVEAEGLKGKVGELEKEIERLTGLTSLPSGGASPAANARRFEEMSLDEQERALREESDQAAA